MTFKEYINYMNDSAIDFNKGVAITVTLPILAAIMLTLAIVYESGASFMAAVFFATLVVRLFIDIWGSYKRYRQIDEPTWALLRLIRSKPENMRNGRNYQSIWEYGGLRITYNWGSGKLDGSESLDIFNSQELTLIKRCFRLHAQQQQAILREQDNADISDRRNRLAKLLENLEEEQQ